MCILIYILKTLVSNTIINGICMTINK